MHSVSVFRSFRSLWSFHPLISTLTFLTWPLSSSPASSLTIYTGPGFQEYFILYQPLNLHKLLLFIESSSNFFPFMEVYLIPLRSMIRPLLDNRNKSPSPRNKLFPLKLLANEGDFTNIKNYFQSLGCHPELDHTILLLKTRHT